MINTTSIQEPLAILEETRASQAYSLDPEATAHILHILRSQLYSNKILAVIREYATNAQDAHAAIGNPNPIEVSLPTAASPNFIVRDFGPGLSEHEVFEVYTKLGRSTKRESNQFTGYIGIGSKSGFCYTDSFLVTSYQKGTQTIYNALLDASGIGKIIKIEQVQSDEPDGLEITIPVKQEDIARFGETAAKFFKNFQPYPHFRGTQLDQSTKDTKHRCIRTKEFTYSNTQGLSLEVVMANVTYPLQAHHIPDRNPGFSGRLTLFVPTGSLQIAANREVLEETESNRNTLSAALRHAETEVTRILQEELSAQKTIKQALEWSRQTITNTYSTTYLSWTSPITQKEFNVPQLFRHKNIIEQAQPNHHCLITKDNRAYHYSENAIREIFNIPKNIKLLYLHDYAPAKDLAKELGITHYTMETMGQFSVQSSIPDPKLCTVTQYAHTPPNTEDQAYNTALFHLREIIPFNIVVKERESYQGSVFAKPDGTPLKDQRYSHMVFQTQHDALGIPKANLIHPILTYLFNKGHHFTSYLTQRTFQTYLTDRIPERPKAPKPKHLGYIQIQEISDIGSIVPIARQLKLSGYITFGKKPDPQQPSLIELLQKQIRQAGQISVTYEEAYQIRKLRKFALQGVFPKRSRIYRFVMETKTLTQQGLKSLGFTPAQLKTMQMTFPLHKYKLLTYFPYGPTNNIPWTTNFKAEVRHFVQEVEKR